MAAAAAWLAAAGGADAQAFLDTPCNITGITFAFEQNQKHRTVQTFSGQGCSASFRGGANTTYESIAVIRQARHLTLTPTSNGFGFSVARRTVGYAGPDSYTLRVCGSSGPRRGCVEITYDVTIR